MSTTALPHGHGDAIDTLHSDAAHAHDPHLAHHFDTPEQQFSTSKLGIWLFLATEILMFGGLFCAYAVYRYNHPEVYLWAHRALDAKWGMINTIVLLASSFTMAWGVRASQLNQTGLLKLMLVLTFMGGVIFMCIKGVEYKAKWEHHLFPGKFNSLNEKFTPPNGADAKELKYETIGIVEHEGQEGHGEGNLQDKDLGGRAPGLNGEGNAHNGGGVSSMTEATSNSGSTHVANNAPNPAGIENPNVGVGRDHDQPSVGQLIKSSNAPQMLIGTLAPADGNAGTADVANVVPPAYVDAGINPNADVKPGHQWTTYEQMEPTDRAQLNTFFSIYFMMTGLHGIHVLVGMGLMAWLFIRTSNNEFSSQYFTPVDLVGLYWHLVDLIWIFLFPLLYLIH